MNYIPEKPAFKTHEDVLEALVDEYYEAAGVDPRRLAYLKTEILDLMRDTGLDQDRLLRALCDNSGQTWFGSNFDTLPHARDGYAMQNPIAALAEDVANAASAAPKDASTTLPETLIRLIREMKPL